MVEGFQWMDYAEIGKCLGVTPGSAQRRAIRGAWERRQDEDGVVRVAVPKVVLQQAEEEALQARQGGGGGADPMPLLTRLLARLEAWEEGAVAVQQRHVEEREEWARERAELREELARKSGALEVLYAGMKLAAA